jgi:hypothetical protein
MYATMDEKNVCAICTQLHVASTQTNLQAQISRGVPHHRLDTCNRNLDIIVSQMIHISLGVQRTSTRIRILMVSWFLIYVKKS